uniref:Uncharacterized protein n=1 Tax=Rhizophora mucronata TaxID=61149 RepID=A0A2P2IKM0_RHIMU
MQCLFIGLLTALDMICFLLAVYLFLPCFEGRLAC